MRFTNKFIDINQIMAYSSIYRHRIDSYIYCFEDKSIFGYDFDSNVEDSYYIGFHSDFSLFQPSQKHPSIFVYPLSPHGVVDKIQSLNYTSQFLFYEAEGADFLALQEVIKGLN